MVSEENRDCSPCQLVKRAMKTQRAGAGKDWGAIFNKGVTEDLHQGG